MIICKILKCKTASYDFHIELIVLIYMKILLVYYILQAEVLSALLYKLKNSPPDRYYK